jgi:cytochrome c oxidase cbb3-type subunit 3
MCSVCRDALVVIAACMSFACEREAREFAHSPMRSASIDYESNAYALSEGKRLYGWYNCSGCHAEGGGDKGPALMDDVWIYGSEPARIFESIADGRPNGMPAFRSKISEQQMWQLTAYVRSMSGLASQQAAPNRPDAIHAKEPESNVDSPPAGNDSTGKP